MMAMTSWRPSSSSRTQQVASDVCYLLSIAQGCKVEWVYREEHDDEGLLVRDHWMRKTKPFCALQAVQLDPMTGVRDFPEATYPTYVRPRDPWNLTRRPIDTYLEGKVETDFLEPRAAKLAVAPEALKHRYLHIRRDPTRSNGPASSVFFPDPLLFDFSSMLVHRDHAPVPSGHLRSPGGRACCLQASPKGNQ